LLYQDWLDTLQNFRCLPRLRSGTNIQVDVGPTNTHLFKENSRKLLVVMLSGVHEERLYKIVRKHRREKRSDLHQIRPGANNTEDFHFNQNLLARSVSSIKDFRNFTELASLPFLESTKTTTATRWAIKKLPSRVRSNLQLNCFWSTLRFAAYFKIY